MMAARHNYATQNWLRGRGTHGRHLENIVTAQSLAMELPVLRGEDHQDRPARADVRRALELVGHTMPDAEMRELITRTFETLASVADKRHDRWVVTYSGGKDSTTVAILASIFL